MGTAAIALALEAMQLLPSLIAAGMDVANLVDKVVAVRDAAAAPDDPTWQQLDAAVQQHQQEFRQAAG